jgi:two-component system NtrC family sensor kinase
MSTDQSVPDSERSEWAAPVPEAARGRRPGERGSGPARLLLIEDNPSDVALVRECLIEPGMNYEIVNVSRLSEAKSLLRSERFDAILLDLRLPDGEELEALGVVQEAAPETPIVVLTGLEDRALARRCIEAGADDYIEKTAMTTSLLRRAVGYALARGKTKELSQRLQHSDRLAAIGRLAVSVAHEINNPITFITMNQELILRRLDTLRGIASAGDAAAFGPVLLTVAEMQELLLENKIGVERIGSIVRDLRSLARHEPDDVSWVDVTLVCKAACAIVANHVRHHARLVMDLREVSRIAVDPRKLEQVVINLVMNASQAIRRGTVEENEVRVATLERDGSVVIAVEDTGSGISPRVRDLMFEPFFSTKASGEGTGLGLSVSADIVASFGGTITVESVENRGSRFEVVLPIREDARAGVGHPRTTRPPPVHARKRILLVDDDAQVLLALRRSLQQSHDVTIASGGAEALATLEREQDFDVILCDLTMPDVDGVAVHAAVVSCHPRLVPRFVAITGGAVTERTSRFVEFGMARIVEKPISPAALLRLIEEVASP